jgi:hypothetical protein
MARISGIQRGGTVSVVMHSEDTTTNLLPVDLLLGNEPRVGFSENRNNQRFPIQKSGALKILQSPPAFERFFGINAERNKATVQINNISQSGIGWFYDTQLFPTEIVEVRFDQFLITAEVVRCRRLECGTFDVGGIVKSFQNLSKQPQQ